MRIKAIDRIEHRSQLRTLLRQIRSRTAAQNQHVDVSFIFFDLGDVDNAVCRRHLVRLSARKNRFQLEIWILLQRQLHTPSQISVTYDAYLNCCHFISSFKYG
ncbi:hypothetical protein D3C76_856300 [compost metagenome]